MDAGLQKILLIDCGAPLRESLADHLYADTASYRLMFAGDGAEALEILAREDIFLTVISAAAGETDRQPYIKEITAGYPHLEILLILPPGQFDISLNLPDHPRMQVITAPCEAAELGGRIKALSQGRPQGFAGTLKNIQLDDLIQMCCLSTTTITIRVSQGAQQGTIHIWDGEIVHAVCGQRTGEEAFYTILGWESGGFETFDGGVSEVATIKKSYEFLLMEAARRADESTGPEENLATTTGSEIATESHAKLRVLMVEDSTVMGKILSSMLAASGDIEVTGIARNGKQALELAAEQHPDLILLDVNMPVMSGEAALKHIMIKIPCPVVVMSNVASGAPDTILSFLDLGAVDFVAKPVKNKDLLLQQQKIVDRIKLAAAADIRSFRRLPCRPVGHDTVRPDSASPTAGRVVILSAGCSGHGALRRIFAGLPPDLTITLIALQSMPPVFLTPLAGHLEAYGHLRANILTDRTLLRQGHFYLATHGCSMRLSRDDGGSVGAQMQAGRQDFGLGPSYFDLLLFSAAERLGTNLQVVLLSGAETGNLEGLRYVRDNGGRLLIQKRAACMMPAPLNAVSKAGLCDTEYEPEMICKHITAWSNGLETTPTA